MYLSRLFINVGKNPDRPRPGRLWLRNLYHVHQRLCMAFPSKEQKKNDPHFLAPYNPDCFPEQRDKADQKKSEENKEVLKQVHAPRDEKAGFLFRIDPQPGGSPVILVQSAIEPDWDYAFQNAQYLLDAPPQVNSFEPLFRKNQQLKFRLLANPVKRASAKSVDSHEKPLDIKWKGKRVPVPREKLKDWLARKTEGAGCHIEEITLIQTGYVYAGKSGEKKRNRFFSVRYEGVLKVIDDTLFKNIISKGIGPAKAFGFGLLTVEEIE